MDEQTQPQSLWPKVVGESAWLTQAVYQEPVYYDRHNRCLVPVKLVFVGVPVTLASISSAFVLGKRVCCERDPGFWEFGKSDNSHYRMTRLPIPGTAYAVSILTCTELVGDLAPSSAVERLLLLKIKEMRLPCLPEWAGYIRDHLGDAYIRPLSVFNTPEPMFLVQLPTPESFMTSFLMQHLGALKEIAERRIAA
jgi:hypothetical protein